MRSLLTTLLITTVLLCGCSSQENNTTNTDTNFPEKTSADLTETDPDYSNVFIESMMENAIVIAPYATDPEASYPVYEIRIDENTRIEGSKNKFVDLKVKDDVEVWVRKTDKDTPVAEKVQVQ